LIGDNPVSMMGGVIAVWVRAQEQPGEIKLTAKHLRLGTQSVVFTVRPAEAEAL
jgi:beta-galactosidase